MNRADRRVRIEATSLASTSSPEPASSPGTPGRYYHPRSHTGDRRNNAKRVPRGVGVDPQRLLGSSERSSSRRAPSASARSCATSRSATVGTVVAATHRQPHRKQPATARR